MGIFTKEEKLFVDKKTGERKWVTTKKGLPRIRKEKTGFDRAVQNFQKEERAKQKTIRKKKYVGYGKKIDNVRSSLSKHVNPDLLLPGGGIDLDLGMGKKKKKPSSDSWDIDPFDFGGF